MTRKLRGFAINESTGAPLPNVPLQLVGVVDVREGDEIEPVPRTLAVFQSDHIGFFSIPIDLPGRIESLAIQPIGDAAHGVDVTTHFTDVPELAVPIPVPVSHQPGHHGSKVFPSVIEPDATDWILSPRSFGSANPLRIGSEKCEELIISQAITRTFRFSQIVREPALSAMVLTAPALPPSAMDAPRLCDGPAQPPLCWRRGALLLYETTWAPMGHALGEIAYSLALAPCEKVNLAVIEWARQDRTMRGEDTSLTEQLRHTLRRDRSIEESVDAVLNESQSGSSVGGGLGVNLGVVNLSLGGSYAGSGGTRSVASDTVQEISDRIVQASTLSQRFNSTVIVQASQAERDMLQTRTVANHNHCHALTVLYYQVLRHFLVTTRLADKQDVVLLKMPVHPFDSHEEVLRHRIILERALLDPTLRPCFNALHKEFCAKVRRDRRGYVEEPAEHELGEIHAEIRTGENGLALSSVASYVEIRALMKSGPPVPLEVMDPLMKTQHGANIPKQSWIQGQRDPLIQSSRVLAPFQEDLLTLRPSRRIDWGEVEMLEVAFEYPAGSSISGVYLYDLAALKLVTFAGGDHWVMCDVTPNVTLEYFKPVQIPLNPFGPQQPADVLTDGELCCVERLMQHLRDNALHYSRALWLAEDRDERARRLDAYGFELDGVTGRLLDFVRNEIVGIIGDYVAIPLAAQEFADTLEAPRPAQRIVSMPTRGLFAEAKLGSCNACEEIDVTRFWDWTESPCPDPAPAIEAIRPGSRGQPASVSPTTSPPSLGIQTPPGAPEPSGIAAVLDALGKSDVFRDMSGKEGTAAIVQDLVKGAIELEKEKIKKQPLPSTSNGTAQAAGTSPAAGASQGASTTKPPSEGRQMHDKLKAIEGAERRGNISPAMAQSASEGVVHGTSDKGPQSTGEVIIPWDWKLTYAADAPVAPNARWAGAVAALLSWRDGQALDAQPYSVADAMKLLDATRPNDPIFAAKFQKGEPILVLPAAGSQQAVDELSELLAATGTSSGARLLRRGTHTFSATGTSFNLPDPVLIRSLLQQYGPLCLAAIGADVVQEGANINGRLGTGFILSGIIGDDTADGTTLQIFTITTKQAGIITFKTFMGIIATQSTTTARNGELFLLHFE